MPFELLPVIDTMLGLYQKPRDFERFRAYLRLLQGDTHGDLQLPLSGFNPMGKSHVVEKLEALKRMDAEGVMSAALGLLNTSLAGNDSIPLFKVILTLSDDQQGGWTNRYAADYDSKFKLNALLNRGFCTPVFWTSEPIDATTLRERTLEYAYRTLEARMHPVPRSLEDHVRQEQRVAANMIYRDQPACDREALARFYRQHHASHNYSLIFNFFYGDAACTQLGYPVFGIEGELPGYCYCRQAG